MSLVHSSNRPDSCRMQRHAVGRLFCAQRPTLRSNWWIREARCKQLPGLLHWGNVVSACLYLERRKVPVRPGRLKYKRLMWALRFPLRSIYPVSVDRLLLVARTKRDGLRR